MRGANWATVGASNTARTARSASRPVLIAAITEKNDPETYRMERYQSASTSTSKELHMAANTTRSVLRC
jgi:hypothetical protein